MTEFTPYTSLAGGVLIGLAASLLLLGAGRIAGISGIAGNLLFGQRGDRMWRGAFVLGLVVVGVLFSALGSPQITPSPRSLGMIALAGLLVGVGTRIGSGCTSGHGVCGLSRLSPRSLVATATFMAAGALTILVLRWIGGAA